MADGKRGEKSRKGAAPQGDTGARGAQNGPSSAPAAPKQGSVRTPRRSGSARAWQDIDATPRFAIAYVIVAYALATLVLFLPALHGAFIVSPVSDQYSGYAYRAFAADMVHATGHFPTWNPYLLGGLPFAAAGFGDVFYPAAFLRYLMPPDAAMTWTFALHIFLAGLFTYAFLRAWGMGFLPSVFGGLAYMLCGKVASLVSPGHDGKLYVSAMAPLLLWMILLGIRDGKLWAWGVAAIATALAIMSPSYQMAYYLGMLAGGFTLYLAFRTWEDGRKLDRRTAFLRLALAVAAALLGVVIAAVQLMPFLQYLPYGARGTAKGYEFATSYSMPPEELINLYLPQFSGILGSYWGRNPLKFHIEYLGVLNLLLMGAAFGNRARRGIVRFWIIAGGIALLVALGGHTPFYRLWYHLPMMSVVRAPDMIFFIPSLAVAFMAAVGMERFFGGAEWRRERYLAGWGIAALVVAILASVGFFTALGHHIAPPERFEMVTANAGHVTAGAWRSALFVVAGVVVLWLTLRGRIPARLGVCAVIVMAAVDFWSVDRLFFNFSPPASELYAASPAIQYLEKLPEPARVMSFPVVRLEARDPFVEGDALMLYHVRATTGHQGNELQRWVDLAGALSPGVDPARLLSPQFRRLTNTKFILTNGPLDSIINVAPLGVRRVMDPVMSSVGTPQYLFEFGDQDAPAAWTATAIVKAPPDQILPTVLDPRFDPASVALFDSSADVPGTQISSMPAPLGIAAHVRRYDPGHITVELDRAAPAGAALVVSENYYPGWSATVDGKPAQLGPADYTLIGVPLPEGARTVDLTFSSRPYHRGLLISDAGLIVALLVIGLGIILPRRRRV
ncbi:MAG TPA: YfhO family protein [Gemmatimonadaceae bacterium]|nr:YfhO family protein [Gemmatimonadaceae bacterium]